MTGDGTELQPARTGGESRTAKTKYTALVAVCAKCAKRQGLTKRDVGRALKREHPKRRVKVVATGCLGPCPKKLVAVATPASLSAGRVVLLDPALPPAAVQELASGLAP